MEMYILASLLYSSDHFDMWKDLRADPIGLYRLHAPWLFSRIRKSVHPRDRPNLEHPFVVDLDDPMLFNRNTNNHDLYQH